MTTPTAARPTTSKDSHWYQWDGTPQYSVIGKTTGKPRPVTLRDAREGNWVPGVTTILRILHKEALQQWLTEQACLAVLTAPRLEKEETDAFVYRVLHTEKQQEEETQIARDKGIEIHEAFENYFSGQAQLIPPDLMAWIQPAVDKLLGFGQSATSEMVLVGDGYAGRTDLIQDCEGCWRMWDIKSTKNLPDPVKGGAYPEHRLQLSAYGRAYVDRLIAAGANTKPLLVGNIYVSSKNPGEFVICEHEGWEETYERGFKPLITHWQWSNNYQPVNPVKPRFTAPPTVERANAEWIALNTELQGKLEAAEQEIKILRQAQAPKPAVPAPARPEPAAPQPMPIPRLNPGQQHVAPALPTTTKDGQRIAWSTGVVAASNGPAK